MPGWGVCVFSLGLAWLCLWRTPLRAAGFAIMAIGLLSPVFYQPPDLLASADGRMIAIRTPHGVYVHKTQGDSRFTADAWAQLWPADPFRPFPDDGQEADGLVNCTAAFCIVHPYAAAPGALLVRRVEPVPSCAGIGIVVATEAARRLCPRPFPALVDRIVTWRDGSAAVWFSPDGVRILSDRQARGNRPWVPPPPHARVVPPPDLPLAETD
jgi:competence protein ComEC